ncbi:MAG: hypothetical protein ABW168_03610 [Sedimenticola sp.]
MIERFRLLTNGQVSESGNIDKIKAFLSVKMKLSAKAVEQALSGQPIAITKSLEWRQVNVLRQHLNVLGLNTAIRLQLNADCLRAGLKLSDNTKAKERHSAKQISPAFPLYFDKQQLNPTLFSARNETKLCDEKGKHIYSIANYAYRWNPLALFVCGLLLSLIIEIYLLKSLSSLFSAPMTVTLAVLVFFFAFIYLFPKLCQSPQLLTFRLCDDNEMVIVEECFSLSVRKKKFILRNHEGKYLGQILRLRTSASFENTQGVKYFFYDSSISLEDSADNMIDKVSSEFVDNTWLGPVIDIYQTSVALISRRNTSSSEQESKSIQGSPVFNADDEHIATLGLSPSPCVQLKNTAIAEQDKVLFMTFSWLALNKFVL